MKDAEYKQNIDRIMDDILRRAKKIAIAEGRDSAADRKALRRIADDIKERAIKCTTVKITVDNSN